MFWERKQEFPGLEAGLHLVDGAVTGRSVSLEPAGVGSGGGWGGEMPDQSRHMGMGEDFGFFVCL